MKKKYLKDREARDLLSREGGGIGRRTLLFTFAAGLLGLGGFILYRLTRIPGAFGILRHGSKNERVRLFQSLATGRKLPSVPDEKAREKKAAQDASDRFERRLERIRAKYTGFAATEMKLGRQVFSLRHANKYFRNLRAYMETIFSAYQVKKEIPFRLLAEKINKFPEKRIFALICCCCGLPDDKGFNYMARSLFRRGYAGLEGKQEGEGPYFLKVVDAVIYLRGAWYRNLVDTTTNNPRKNEALQLVWNFLNTQDLPHDLVKNKNYYLRPLT